MTTPSQPPQVAHGKDVPSGLPVTPRTSEAAGYPSNDWHATADRLFICSQQLEEELAAQQAELLALRADKLRLDWLADPSSPLPRICLFPSHGYYNRVDEKRPSVHENLRESIDRAIADIAALNSPTQKSPAK